MDPKPRKLRFGPGGPPNAIEVVSYASSAGHSEDEIVIQGSLWSLRQQRRRLPRQRYPARFAAFVRVRRMASPRTSPHFKPTASPFLIAVARRSFATGR